MRTSIFFLAVAAVCAAMIPPTPPEFRGVNYFCIALALFWALAYQIEYRLARRRGEHPERILERDATESDLPFTPPPSRGSDVDQGGPPR